MASAGDMISLVCVLAIIVVTVILIFRDDKMRQDCEMRVKAIAEKVNEVNSFKYFADKTQYVRLSKLEDTMNKVQKNYVSKNELAQGLNTKNISAENINANIVKSNEFIVNNNMQYTNFGMTSRSNQPPRDECIIVEKFEEPEQVPVSFRIDGNKAIYENIDAYNLNATNGTLKSAVIDKGTIINLEASNASINSLVGTDATFKTGAFDNLKATNANIATIASKQGNFDKMNVKNGSFTDLNIHNTLTTTKLDTKEVRADAVYTSQGEIKNLTATKGDIDNILSKSAVLETISGKKASFDLATGREFKGATATFDNITSDLLKAKTANISDTLTANSALVGSLSANSARIKGSVVSEDALCVNGSCLKQDVVDLINRFPPGSGKAPGIFKGGKSVEFNPNELQTKFPDDNGRNSIRGNTDIYGNSWVRGDAIVDRNIQVPNGSIKVYKKGDENLGVSVFSTGLDGATADKYNGGIESWYGIGFRNKGDKKARFIHDTRTGDTKIHGSIAVDKNVCVGEGDNPTCFDKKDVLKFKSAIIGDNPTFKQVTASGVTMNGGDMVITNGANKGVTYFNHKNTGLNFIRGDTEVTDTLNVNGVLCVGNTCMDEGKLKIMMQAELPSDIDKVYGGVNSAHDNPGDKFQTAESCRKQALASNGKYVAWGFRTDYHPSPEWQNTCFLYTAPFAPFKGNPADIAHQTGCLRPGERVEWGCKTSPDKVDCKVSNWSDWGACSKTCGGGTQTRNRIVTEQPKGSGAACPALSETQACNTQGCPVDCKVGEWTNWSGCTKPCGGGTQTRTRSVTVPVANGGAACPALSETQACNTQACPLDCQVSEWSAWSACDKPCGGGSQTRTRTITKPAENGGKPCPALTETQACNTHGCPVDCQVSWHGWSSCTKPCGGGTQTRTRSVTVPAANGGKECPPLTETQACNTQACPQPVNCVVSDWSGWSACSKSCGADGIQTRTRNILQQSANGGIACPTNLSEIQPCNRKACPPAYKYMGCFADKAHTGSPRPITHIGGGYNIDSCAALARSRGHKAFAIQANEHCMTDANAHVNYNRDGGAGNCANGRGGDWANDVYLLRDYQNVGCYADAGHTGKPRPIAHVGGGYDIDSCAAHAHKIGAIAFAIQAGNNCMTDFYAHHNFNRDGPSENCYAGRGGDWTNNVYSLYNNL